MNKRKTSKSLTHIYLLPRSISHVMSFNKCKSPKAKSQNNFFLDFNAENRCYQLIDMRAVVSKILHTEPHVLLKNPGTWIIRVLLNQIRLMRDLISKRLS